MRKLVTTFRRGWHEATTVGARLILSAIAALFVLSFVQLAITVVFSPAYVDWFLADHGWATSADAPPGEVPGIYAGIAMRCVFSLFWVLSFTRLLDYVVARSTWSLRVVVGYGLIATLGYGYWVIAGGPWWMTLPRVLQVVAGLVLVGATLSPTTRRWLRANTEAGTLGDMTEDSPSTADRR